METTYKLKSGNLLKIIQEEQPESPNQWWNEDLFLVYDHKQFTVKREGFKPLSIFKYLKLKQMLDNADKADVELIKDITDDLSRYEDYSEKYFIFTVYAYIHSGVALSLIRESYPFNDMWDVSSTGFILADKSVFLDENKAFQFAEDLIKIWNQFLSGDVYGFALYKPNKFYKVSEEQVSNATFVTEKEHRVVLWKDEIVNPENEIIEWEEIDSCWGFYGSDPKTNGMLENINDEII